MPDRHNDAPSPTEVPNARGASEEGPSEEDSSEGGTPPALNALRNQVHRAASEIGRLREKVRHLEDESESLRERVEELEEDPSAGRDGTALLVDDDPDALREQIDHFIQAIDTHITERGV